MNRKEDSKNTIDELLQGIQKVEAPQFLFTKIQTSIRKQLEDRIPLRYVWMGAFSLVILLTLNIWTMQKASVQAEDNIIVIIEEMDLIPDNSFF